MARTRKYKKYKISKEKNNPYNNKKGRFVKKVVPAILIFSLGRISASVDIIDLLNKFMENNQVNAYEAVVQCEPTSPSTDNIDIDTIIATTPTETIEATESVNNYTVAPTEIPTEMPSEEPSMTYEDTPISQNILGVGSDENVYLVKELLDASTETGQLIEKYSEMYGVDPNVIAAICMQESSLQHDECCPGGDRYWGYGVGLMQLESPKDSINEAQEVTAYNYQTNCYDTEYITMENACNLEKNIQIGCMLFQNNLQNNNGNILLSIVAHNYGQPMVDIILTSAYGDSELIKYQYDIISWNKYMEYAHYHPSEYIDNWSESKYGDGEYLKHVLRFCPSTIVNYKYDNKEYSFDLNSLKVIDVQELDLSTKVM